MRHYHERVSVFFFSKVLRIHFFFPSFSSIAIMELKTPAAPRLLGKTDDLDDETVRNTKLNAELFHTSNDSVELYRQENNSSDLLGRLYYDDYDSDSMTSPSISGVSSPMPLSPIMSPSESSDQLSVKSRPPFLRMKSMERGISFDTSPHGHQKSYTLKAKHPLFKFRRTNKTFLVGYNDDLESTKAIEWLFDEMIINGDTIVVLQVLDEKQHVSIDKSKVQKNLAKIEQINHHFKKVCIIYEAAIGKAKKAIRSAIDEYRPSMMAIGTHHYDGKEHHRSFTKSSLSKHILECSLVPIILVKPSYRYVEFLRQEVDGPQYFENWIKNIDHIDNRVIRKKVPLISPSVSRNSSYTNLVNEDRGRGGGVHDQILNESRSRSTSKNRVFARFFKK